MQSELGSAKKPPSTPDIIASASGTARDLPRDDMASSSFATSSSTLPIPNDSQKQEPAASSMGDGNSAPETSISANAAQVATSDRDPEFETDDQSGTLATTSKDPEYRARSQRPDANSRLDGNHTDRSDVSDSLNRRDEIVNVQSPNGAQANGSAMRRSSESSLIEAHQRQQQQLKDGQPDNEFSTFSSDTSSQRTQSSAQANFLQSPRAALNSSGDPDSPDSPSSFRGSIIRERPASSTSSSHQTGSRDLFSSDRDTHSGSIPSLKAFLGSQSPSPGAGKGSPLSLASSRDNSPSTKVNTNVEASTNYEGAASGTRSPHSYAKMSPLDNLDRLLANESPVTHVPKSTSARLPLRLGLLSFNEEDYDGTEHGITNGDTSDRLRSRFSAAVESGVRRQEDRSRKLETENMELRLKLQQYREMNASEQEITRVKWQVDRAERRIDELEQALERKNRTILELSEERDRLAAKVRPDHEIEDLQVTISELQTAITELESQSLAAEEAQEATSSAISGLREVIPTLIAPGAAVDDLVSAMKQLHAENMRLSETDATCEKISQLLRQSGHHENDPVSSVNSLILELADLQHNIEDLKQVMAREHQKHSHDLNLLKESHSQQTERFMLSEDKLRQQLAKAQALQTTLEAKVAELEEIVENQHKIVSDTRADNYAIVRRFFSELIDVMGPDFQASVEEELQNVVDTAQSQGVSKLPLLTELLLRYTREIAEEAVRSYTAPTVDLKVRAMEQEVQSLEHMLAMKLDKSGADAILLAQNRDLRRALKLEQEKRKTDWNEYNKTISAIR